MITIEEQMAMGFSTSQISPFPTDMTEKFSYFCVSILDSHFEVLSFFVLLIL